MTKEEKDKLIELSDLNREDNIKYISSEAQGIAITLDMDRYAPTFCKLERAYICGRRKSEKQIAELEKENAEQKKKNKWYSEQVCNKECSEVWGNLTKATDLLKKMYYLYFDPCVTHKDLENRDKLFEEVKQFLKEIEK